MTEHKVSTREQWEAARKRPASRTREAEAMVAPPGAVGTSAIAAPGGSRGHQRRGSLWRWRPDYGVGPGAGRSPAECMAASREFSVSWLS